MFRGAAALLAGSVAIVLFLAEYIFAIWPSLHIVRAWAVLFGCVKYRRLAARKRKVAMRRGVKRAAARWYSFWGSHIWCWVCPLLGLKAQACLPPELMLGAGQTGRPVVLISNHQNSLDALFLLWITHLLGINLTWIAKREMARIPGVGLLLRLLDCAFVGRRGDPRDIARVRKSAIRANQDGFSYGIFPEGHRRSKQTVNQRFKYLGEPRSRGFITVCDKLPGYPVLVLTINWSGHGTTMMDAGRLYGANVTVTGELFYNVTELQPTALETWLIERWQEMDARLEIAATASST